MLEDCGGQLVGRRMQRMLAPSQRKLLHRGCVSLGEVALRWYQKDEVLSAWNGHTDPHEEKAIFTRQALSAHVSL